jgi:hypothetical protein
MMSNAKHLGFSRSYEAAPQNDILASDKDGIEVSASFDCLQDLGSRHEIIA